MNATYDWIAFYSELANKLLPYKNNRDELLTIIKGILERTERKNYFHDVDDMCPFTTMGMFNLGIKDSNRIKTLEAFAEVFGIVAPIPKVFEGIPILNNMKSWFFSSKAYDRTKHIDELWNLFEASIFFADNPTDELKARFIKAFNFVISQPVSKWITTCGLYWIRANSYIPLDGNTRAYLKNRGFTFKGIPSGENYLKICEDVKYKVLGSDGIDTFPMLSRTAWLENNHESAEKISYWLCYAHENDLDIFMTEDLYAYARFRGNDLSESILNTEKWDEFLKYIKKVPNRTEKEQSEFISFKQIKKGDKIALFSSYKYSTPSEIKSIGRVTGNAVDCYRYDKDLGHIINIKWETSENLKVKLNGIYQHEINRVNDEDIDKIFSKNTTNIIDNFITNQVININELLDRFRIYVENSGVKRNGSRYKNAVKKTFDYLGYGEIVTFPDMSEIISELENLRDSFDEHKNKIKVRLKEKEQYLINDGWIHASFSHIIPFLKKTSGIYLPNREIINNDISTPAISLKELAIKVLEDTRKPMTDIEIWEYALSKDWDEQLSTIGKTPWQSIYAILSSYKDGSPNSDKRIKIIDSTQRRKFVISSFNEEFVSYDKNKFLFEVYFNSDKYDDIVALLNRKKNIILQGAPGVGKSYMAKRLAYSIIGAKDEEKIEMIQFHQNYSYEDFIEGYRPCEDGGFELKQGVFYNFCDEAKKYEQEYINCINSKDEDLQKEADKYKCFFIIDEINRGNLSKVMGELMLLLENDKRGEEFSMKLTYSCEPFYVPENVYVIGMMNTADRSLAMIDYALRRRFSFVPIEPVFEHHQFIADFKNNYHEAETIIEKIKKLNDFIAKKLDIGHQIGHSYFCSKKPFSQKDIEGILKYEIEELLNEYFFDDEDVLKEAKDKLK
ncbi:MAG: AAA family ATPase [Oscillospiraceae bacterium]|nr:AAA family ATPase [Oscillospiraceae bacterium]